MTNPNMFNSNDSFDINELAALNDDISPEFIEQLQQKLVNETNANKENAETPAFNVNDDTTLFEETKLQDSQDKTEETIQTAEPNTNALSANDDRFDDSFVRKYKAKLNKQQQWTPDEPAEPAETAETAQETTTKNENKDETTEPKTAIEKLTNGKILEKSLTPEQKSYNDSLDYLDGNVKYSKYVIYIDPQNVDFIENLTVKERKNLIKKVLKEQGDIAITKQRFKVINMVVKHAIVAVLTLAISVPVIYYAINASLEATINNYRSSQQNFQVLYKENGKITKH